MRHDLVADEEREERRLAGIVEPEHEQLTRLGEETELRQQSLEPASQAASWLTPRGWFSWFMPALQRLLAAPATASQQCGRLWPATQALVSTWHTGQLDHEPARSRSTRASTPTALGALLRSSSGAAASTPLHGSGGRVASCKAALQLNAATSSTTTRIWRERECKCRGGRNPQEYCPCSTQCSPRLLPATQSFPHCAIDKIRSDNKINPHHGQALLGGRRSGGGQEPVQKQRAPHACAGQE